MEFVERTCTAIEGSRATGGEPLAVDPIELGLQVENGTVDWQTVQSALDGQETTGKPLSCYAEHPAWVLLAPAGAGKTVAFQREAERLGPHVHYTTARDFVTLNRPEWRNSTIFIDALDEMRAGASDGRTPLDEVRKKLDGLGHPPFRLSCREADWFGANDRDHLASVAQGGNVLVLQLDPLTDEQILRLLAERENAAYAEEFVEYAESIGLGSLLHDPLTLYLLAEAFAGGGRPDGRRMAFELACRQLTRECNDEHVVGDARPASTQKLLDAAGRLCAVSLLSGHEGYAARTATHDQAIIPLLDIPAPPQALLRAALSTRLFMYPDGKQCAVPMHRQIAEFLAARYLVQLAKNGLPRKRITALATGPDGGIVTPLRGLVAWLAAFDKEIRSDCIERDPLDTMLYGDVRWFSVDDKRRLVQRIKERASRDSWLLRNRFELNARWGGLATKDAEPIFREVLANIEPDTAAGELLVWNMLVALWHGDEELPLGDLLLDIVRDRDASDLDGTNRSLALEVFVKWHGNGSGTDQTRELLHDVENGTIDDPLDDLRGILLAHLYPDHLGPAEVIQYLHEPRRRNWIGSYLMFCDCGIIASSTPCQLQQLLDGLCGQEGGNVLGTLRNKVLQHLLKQSLNVPVERLFKWLSMEREWETDDALARWLKKRPDKYKELVSEAAKRFVAKADGNWRERSILGTMAWLQEREPPDFGIWCLDRAVAAKEQALAEFFMEGVHFCLRFGCGCEGLSESVVTTRIEKHPYLEERWHMLKAESARTDARTTTTPSRTDDWRQPWRSWLRDHEAEVRGNCPPHVLHELGRMCLGYFGVEGDTPKERLHDVLQDDALVQLALDAIRDTPKRSDLPSVAEVAKCKQARPLANSYATAMELSPHQPLDGAGIGLALAFRFHSGRLHTWYESILEKQPGLVADTLLKYCRTAFKYGNYPTFALACLAKPNHAAVAELAALKLLAAFPPRCSIEHLPALRHLLVAALKHARDGLPELLRRKAALRSMTAMQRVHWLCCGLGLEPASYREHLIETLTGRGEYERILRAINLMNNGVLPVSSLDVQATGALVEHLGARWRPYEGADSGYVADAADASGAVQGLIDHLVSLSESAATDALERLARNPRLERWQDRLRHAVGRQLETRREAEFGYANVRQVIATLNGGNPANSADLAALTTDHLRQLADSVTRGNTSDWRQYWNFLKGQQPTPKDENLCRDALLSDLRSRLPAGVDAQPEGRYAADRRADIRVSCKGFNVPVEIKRSNSPDLWTAIGTQLMAKYTIDPGADRHGIYLVFWFGPEHCQKRRDGETPKTPEQFEKQLRDNLTLEEARKIEVIVVDVSDQKRTDNSA